MTNITSARPASVLVEDERARALKRPGQNPGLELSDLFAVTDDNGVFADQVHAADVSIEVDADARPIEARGDLLDVTRLAGPMPALDHHASVVHEPREQRQRGVTVEDVVRVERRNVLLR